MAEVQLIATLVFLAVFAALRAAAGPSGVLDATRAGRRPWLPHLRARRGPALSRDSRAQLAEALGALGLHLRAGATLPQALRWLADEAEGQRESLLRAAARADRGDWAAGLDDLAAGLGAGALPGLRAAVEVHRLTGGDLGPVLERWGQACRTAVERQAELRARTAEARGSAAILAATPVLMGAYVIAFHPDLWQALRASGLGAPALAYALASWVGGVAAIRWLLRRAEMPGAGGETGWPW